MAIDTTIAMSLGCHCHGGEANSFCERTIFAEFFLTQNLKMDHV